MVHISIVEDDNTFTNTLKQYLTQYQKENGCEFQISVYQNGADFLEHYDLQSDLVLMDIEMPVMNGMDAAVSLRKIDPLVVLIFITNTTQYAIQGYAVDAMDYIVKPIRYSHFAIKLDKALRYLPERAAWHMIPTGEGLTRIAYNRIYYVEAKRHNIIFHTAEGVFPTRNSLKAVEQSLREHGFSRPNNSFLLNLSYVQTVRNKQVVLKGCEFTIGRAFRASFLDDLTAYIGGHTFHE